MVTENGRFIDGQEMDAKDLLRYMENKEQKVGIELPSVSEYKKFFEEKLLLSERIIHISMGRKESAG